MFLQTERTCSSGSHCCYRGTSGRPLTALNGRTPAKPRSCWQTEILHNNLTKFSITCRHLQNMLHLHQNYKNRKFTLSFHLKIHSYIFLCCNLLYFAFLCAYLASVQAFKGVLGSQLIASLLQQTELCHRIFLVLHKVKQVIHD